MSAFDDPTEKARNEYDVRVFWLKEDLRLGHISPERYEAELTALDRLAFPERNRKAFAAEVMSIVNNAISRAVAATQARPLPSLDGDLPCKRIVLLISRLDPDAFENVAGQLYNDELWRIFDNRSKGRWAFARWIELRCGYRMIVQSVWYRISTTWDNVVGR